MLSALLGLFPVLAVAQVSNTARIATPPGVTDTDPSNNTSTVVTPLVGTLDTVKRSDIGSGVSVSIGQVLTYTLTTTVSGGPLGRTLTLTDTFSAGLAFGAVTSAGSFSCNNAAPVICTLPSGTAAGSYSVSYTAVVTQAAVSQVSNTVVPSDGTCSDCNTNNPLVTVATSKRSDVGAGTAVERGQTITYTVTTQVSGNGSLTSPLVLTDTLSSGLTFGSIVSAGAFSCVAGNPVRCTLPVGTAAGTYPVSYSATVNASAVTQVSNTVVPSSGTCTDCNTVNPLVEIATRKSSNVGDGAQVAIGDTLVYTLTTTITGGALAQPLTLTDTIGSGLTFNLITRAGAFACNAANPVVCTLPAGTPAGTYDVSYSATVAPTATVSVRNAVVASAGTCDPCSTLDPLVDVLTRKASDIGTGTGVQIGDTITYTLTTNISGSGSLPSELVLTDTLSAGLAFGSITSAGSFSCTGNNPIRCTLPTGTGPGVYSVSYTAVVQASATASVNNTVVPSQGDCVDCSTDNPLLQIRSSKTVDVGSGTAVQRGQLLTYTVTTVLSGNGELSQPFTLTDTLGAGLVFNAITASGAFSCTTGNPVVCRLPTGTTAGTYVVSYTALVGQDATTSVGNSVVPSEGTCTTCDTVNPLVEIATSKSVDVGAGVAVARGQLSNDLSLYARYSRAEIGRQALTQAQASLEWRIGDYDTLSGEVRRVEEQRLLSSATGVLGAVKYAHQFGTSLNLYGLVQATLDDDGGQYEDNNALVAGGKYLFGDQSSVTAEGSVGDRGNSALLSGEYRLTPEHSLYAGYTYSTDITDQESLFEPNRQNGWTLGQRWRLSERSNMFNESQFIKEPQQSGLAHTYGMDFYPAQGWNMGFTLQSGDLQKPGGADVDRRAVSISGGHTSPAADWQSKLEWRRDKGAENRTQWVTTNRLTWKINESWRIAARINYSDTDDDYDRLANARFMESNLGFAWRPWNSTRWALFGRYTYLYDLATLGQVGGAEYDQRTQVLSLEGVYKQDQHWEYAVKLARRDGDVRMQRGYGPWFDSATNFAAAQLRYELRSQWHALAEYRWLDVADGGTRQGFLVGLDRDITRNFRLGVGYNFTEFSDDLTNFDYDHRGWFLNMTGMY